MGLFVGMSTGCSGGESAQEQPALETASSPLNTGPDLVVTDVRGPASVTSGSTSFTTTVTVCNQGTAPAYRGSTVAVLLSLDNVLSPLTTMPPPSDQSLAGQETLHEDLSVGQCADVRVLGTAWLPPAAQGEGAYFLGAIADANQSVVELNENNNTHAQARIGVGNRPDLIITELSSPPSVPQGGYFTVAVTVCNQGTVSVPSVRTQLFLSTDTVLTPTGPGAPPMDQSPIGEVLTQTTLNAGACVRRSVSVYAAQPPVSPGPGAFYLGAIVDDPASVQELREDNNAYAKELIGVGNRPDLIITELRGPASVPDGQSFQVQVRVCNQGTTYANAHAARLFLSTDNVLTPMGPGAPPTDQSEVGMVQLPLLNPGQCATRTASAQAWLPPAGQGAGSYFLGAIVDDPSSVQELREDNNTYAKERIGVGNRPDLVVTALTSPASLSSGQSWPFSVTVCNQGTTQSYSTMAQLYLSLNATVTPMGPMGPPPSSQSPMGYISIPGLAPGQCVTRGENLWASLPPFPTEATAFYLAAIVDDPSSVQELREDNNVFVKGLVGMGNRPDLIVTDVSVPPTLSPGQSFTASVTVCNQGTTSSSSTNAQLYLSMDTTLTPMSPGPGGPPPTDQAPLGMIGLPSLSPGQCTSRSANVWVNYPMDGQGEGAYYVGAIVDEPASVQELREDNNAFVKGLVGVGNRADLVITAMTGPASFNSSQSFTATVTFCNQGLQSSPSTNAQLYLSTDTTLTPMSAGPGGPPLDQVPLGSLSVPSLNAGACLTRSGSFYGSPPPPDGTGDGAYYLAAIVDDPSSVQELREDNNVFVKGLIGVGNRPDLVVTALNVPQVLQNGQSFTASVTVCNQGTTSSYSTQAQIYVSTDTVLTPMLYGPGGSPATDQSPAGYVPLPSLNPGQCATRSTTAWAGLPPDAQGSDGAYYVGAIVDDPASVQELREDNNSFVKGPIGIGNRPDLVITAMTAPTSASINQPFTVGLTVCNQGTTTSTSTQARFLLSVDAALSSMSGPGYPPGDQTEVANVSIPSLTVGQCATRSVSATAWLPQDAQGDGAYYVGAIVDDPASVQELREDNNSFVKGLIGVGSRADLVITAMTSPTSVTQGQAFSTTVTVCNQGTQSSAATYVEVVLSLDDVLSLSMSPTVADQVMIGSVSVPSLLAAQCISRSTSVNAYVPPGGQGTAYYLGALVDSSGGVQELREDNNTFVKGLLGVGTKPDLVVTSLTGPASILQGNTFSSTVRVCNQGTQVSPSAWVSLYTSLDANLSPEPSMPGPGSNANSDQRELGGVNVIALNPGDCITQTLSVSAWLPMDAMGQGGAYFLGAYVDPYQSLMELREDNNSRAIALQINQ
ncbi:CARDB domain-containing protein [Corallococcus terminator]